MRVSYGVLISCKWRPLGRWVLDLPNLPMLLRNEREKVLHEVINRTNHDSATINYVCRVLREQVVAWC